MIDNIEIWYDTETWPQKYDRYYVLYYQHDEETLDSLIPHLYLRYKKDPDLKLPPPSPLFVGTSLKCVSFEGTLRP